jgi:hypothetical protein
MTTSLLAQQKRCSTNENEAALMLLDPNYQAKKDAANALADNYSNLNATLRTSGESVIYDIPVVFHVVYKNGAQDINILNINQQITRLNDDFGRTNSDAGNTPAGFLPIAGATNIRFHLATTNPSGAATSGVMRYSTAAANDFTVDGNEVKMPSMGGVAPWDPANYLNIWVCEIEPIGGGGVLGYAQFPGTGPASTDGVVLDYRYVGNTSGSYNMGRTATHEVGHYLGLKHIWGDDGGSCSGSDLIGDTPNQSDANYGCPSYPQYDACSGSSPGVMFMNFMDYVDDDCMNAFTNAQVIKMENVLSTTRSNLAEVGGGGTTGPFGLVCSEKPLPFSQGFESGAWYPADWIGINPDGLTTWARSTSVKHSGTSSFIFDNYNYPEFGQLDAFCTPAYNLGLLSNKELTFWVAYTNAQSTTPGLFYNDELKVYFSTNCGSTWTSIYSKSGSALATAPTFSTAPFVPTASQWRKETISLSGFNGITNFKFENVAGYGNNLYIDDIAINTSVGILDAESNLYSIYPNPNNGNVTLIGDAHNAIKIELFDATGKLVYNQMHNFDGATQLDFQHLSNGVYYLKLDDKNTISTEKIIISK